MMEDQSRLTGEVRIRLRCEVSKTWVAKLWLAGALLAFMGCAWWFIWTTKDPNYRLSFTPDNLIRIRNVLFVACIVPLVVGSIDLFRIATGRKAIAHFELDGQGAVVVTQPGGFLNSVRQRTTALASPVTATWSESRSIRILGGAYPRNLYLRSTGARIRLSTLWAWREDDAAQVRELLDASSLHGDSAQG